MKRFLLMFAMVAFAATGFAQNRLVIYFSESGTTKKVAEDLSSQFPGNGAARTA